MKPLVLSKYFLGLRSEIPNDIKAIRPTIHRRGCHTSFFEWINPLAIKVYLGDRAALLEDNIESTYNNKNDIPTGWIDRSGGYSLYDLFYYNDKEDTYHYQLSKCKFNKLFAPANLFVVNKDVFLTLSVDAQVIYAICSMDNSGYAKCDAKMLLDDKEDSKHNIKYAEYKSNFVDVAVKELKDSYDNGMSDIWVEYKEDWGNITKLYSKTYPKKYEFTIHRRNPEAVITNEEFDLSDVGEFRMFKCTKIINGFDILEHSKSADKKVAKSNNLSYVELLADPRWQKKSAEIKMRDEWKCQLCGCTDMQLVVHHLIYHRGHAPWEYNDNELLTICKVCHEKLHKNKLA